MKKITHLSICLLVLLSLSNVSAQVGIGTIAPRGALEINSAVNGFLAPQVILTATNVSAPVVNPQTAGAPIAGTVVYNTATAGAGTTAVTPGYYYWDGSLWIRLATGTNSDWSTTGNSGTVATTNFAGTTDAVAFVLRTNNLERTRITSAGLMGVGTPTPSSALSVASNTTIGATYAPTNAAPTNGLRVEGQSIIGKASGEDSRDKFSSHTSATSFNNVTGYPSATAPRAIAGYADADGMGVFGFSNRTGYGVVGLTQSGTLSSYIQTGEGVLGQADGASGGSTIPIGVHGIIDESAAGLRKATPVLGENNNITIGTGLSGGAYVGSGAVAGVYGNIGTKYAGGSSAYQFGVVGDILLLGPASQPVASGGVLGTNASGDFGILGYKSIAGNPYSVYGGGSGSNVAAGNTGRQANTTTPNNLIGLGINGGFMGGYVKGEQYGMIAKGKEFGMYVQGNTIVNEPIVQLIENPNSNIKTAAYTSTSTNVDVTTRGTNALKNGTTFVAFKEAFRNLVSKEELINVTVTPTSETNGVYVSEVTSEGFYIKENQKGTSNASFNWVAIGTRAGFEKGVEISTTILSKDFDKNMNGVMSNDGTGKEGTPIYFDGQNVRFERIPENLVKYAKKEQPKK
ncbi:hypothetical protein [Flavobacterium sp.]|uniref:hypothetical protein n=1 Tax=Flavobacterium sp. TaxID=239 RepID=UPI002B4AAE21|nr:hypothetical protein [Flavobacterium sp.]HLF52298.1 hypothetical protein [Flavobacterium sp.]